MKRAPIPANDAERLAALHALEILDTPREERFDRLVRLACRLLDVPIAAVSLIDTSRQWFKAIEGLDASETPRDVSFCGHAIDQGHQLVVENALEDPRFADNPLVSDAPNIRAYAGQPVESHDGFKLGTICAIDTRARPFSDVQLAVLADLAKIVERELQIEELLHLQQRTRRAEQDAAKRAAELADYFELSIDMLCIANKDGYFTRVNPSWTRTLGWTEEQLLSRPYVDLVHPDDRAATIAEASRLESGQRSVRFENRYRCVDGTWRQLVWNAVAPEDEGLVYAIARDVTEERRVETMKNEFVSTVSHELRTPLTSIRGSIDLVVGGVAGAVPDEARELLEVASSNCQRLSLLINDILDMEKIESGRMEFSLLQHDLQDLIEAAIVENASFATTHGVRFHFERDGSPARVKVDAARIHQVLVNLLSNGAKYGPEGTDVSVAIARGKDAVVVSVSDGGPGIPADQQERIFDKFVQVDSSSTREKGGTGLGLAISKAIVERHGGSIGVESRRGQGTRFWFRLPLAETEQPRPVGTRPRVLVCEGDETAAHALRAIIEDAGFDCDLAPAVQQAEALLRERVYAGLVLDLVLPEGTSQQLLRFVRECDATSDLPVIAVSMVAGEERANLEGAGLRMIDWIEKPIDRERLRAALRTLALPEERKRFSILHVEDDHDIQLVVRRVVNDVADVSSVDSLADAEYELASRRYDLVLLDLRLADGDGADLLQSIAALEEPVPVVVFSAHDAGDETARRVSAVLLKSRTGIESLRRVILEHLREPAAVGG